MSKFLIYEVKGWNVLHQQVGQISNSCIVKVSLVGNQSLIQMLDSSDSDVWVSCPLYALDITL